MKINDEMIKRIREEVAQEIEDNRERYNEEAMARSAEFAEIHNRAMSKANISDWKVGNEDIELEYIEILFMRYISGRSTNLVSYVAGYWTHEHKLDYNAVITRLFRGGYVDFETPEYLLKKQLVADLKHLLGGIGLPTDGRKADLIARILENIPKERYYLEFPETYFTLTDKGKALLRLNSLYRSYM